MHLSAPLIAALSLSTCAAAGPLSFRKSLCARSFLKTYTDTPCQVWDESAVAKLVSLRNTKRQIFNNVTVPTFLWNDLMAELKEVQEVYQTVGPLVPAEFSEVLEPMNSTLTEMKAYVAKRGR